MKIRDKISEILDKRFNFSVVKVFPRHSIRFAKKYFKNNPIDVIEIGTWKGHNAKNICDNLNIKKIYTIDPYKTYSEKHKTKNKLLKSEKEADLRLSQYPRQKIKRTSDEAFKIIPKVDFIYIDGDHTYKQAKKDMENYLKKLKKGGILAGHDITRPGEDYGVAKAFVEFCAKNKLKPYISRDDWWTVKQ